MRHAKPTVPKEPHPYHLCVRPRALDGGVAFGHPKLIGVLPQGAFVFAVLDSLVERVAHLRRTLERLS